MKTCIVALFLFAACAGPTNQAQTQLSPAKEDCCAECPAGCCADDAQKAEGKSECCADEAHKAGKSDCCAPTQGAAKPKADNR